MWVTEKGTHAAANAMLSSSIILNEIIRKTELETRKGRMLAYGVSGPCASLHDNWE
jgi:hypothetical protein